MNTNKAEISLRRHSDWCLLCLCETGLREVGRPKSHPQTLKLPAITVSRLPVCNFPNFSSHFLPCSFDDGAGEYTNFVVNTLEKKSGFNQSASKKVFLKWRLFLRSAISAGTARSPGRHLIFSHHRDLGCLFPAWLTDAFVFEYS